MFYFYVCILFFDALFVGLICVFDKLFFYDCGNVFYLGLWYFFKVNCACIVVIFFWIWPLGKVHVFMRWFCGVFLWIFICIFFCFDDVLVFSFVHCRAWPVSQAHALGNLWFWSLGQFHVFLYLVLVCWIIKCFCFFVVFEFFELQ